MTDDFVRENRSKKDQGVCIKTIHKPYWMMNFDRVVMLFLIFVIAVEEGWITGKYLRITSGINDFKKIFEPFLNQHLILKKPMMKYSILLGKW